MSDKPDADTFVFCPTYTIDGKIQMHPETLRSIEALQGEHHFQVGLYNPSSAKDVNILNQYKTARQITLTKGYEYLLTIEHDMIVPPDALIKLKAAGAPVAYGLYMLRHNSGRLNAWKRIPHKTTLAEDFAARPGDLERAKREKIVEVAGVGFGCTLFRRDALEAVPFEPGSARSHVPDVKFAETCLIKGIKQVCRFDVICGHIEPDGNVLWPFDKRGKYKMTRVKIIQTFNGTINGRSEHFDAGKEVEMPTDAASEYERAGLLIQLDKPTVKPGPADPGDHQDEKPTKVVIPPIRKEPLDPAPKKRK